MYSAVEKLREDVVEGWSLKVFTTSLDKTLENVPQGAILCWQRAVEQMI